MRQKDENKRTAIYTGALKVITAEGISDASMSKIAREAKVSPATIYIYFDNKEDMLNKLYLMVKNELSSFLFADSIGDLPLPEELSLYMKRLFHFMAEHPLLFSFHEQFGNSPRIKDEVKKEAMAEYAPMFRAYERGRKEGLIRDIPVLVAGAFIISPILTLVKIHLSGEMDVTEEMLDKAADMAIGALLV